MQLTVLPTSTTTTISRIAHLYCHICAGLTIRPIVTKNTALNILRSTPVRSWTRLRTDDSATTAPTKKAPKAKLKFIFSATNETPKQIPSTITNSVSSSRRRSKRLRNFGKSRSPNTSTPIRNSVRSVSCLANSAAWNCPVSAKPLRMAITPIVRTSSVSVTPKMMEANLAFEHPISSRLLASRVVEESQMTAPRKRLGSISHLKT